MKAGLIDRRRFCCTATAGLAAGWLGAWAGADRPFRFRYMVATCMYGGMSLEKIVPEVPKSGAEYIDVWASHAEPIPQRQMIDRMGADRFQALLGRHGVRLGCLTHYRLGPFRLQSEMRVARRLGGPGTVLVCGAGGPRGLHGQELRAAVRQFAQKLAPHLAVAEATDTVMAIENHGHSLIESPDALKWLTEFCGSRHLGIALAPYHLEQDADKIAALIRSLGNRIALFYAWQYGKGCMKKLPKEQELMQLPGRGPLDFGPIVAALKAIRFAGLVEVFMHPVPRGIPIRETASGVTAEINRARTYLERCLRNV